jgi:hypothetical protein
MSKGSIAFSLAEQPCKQLAKQSTRRATCEQALKVLERRLHFMAAPSDRSPHFSKTRQMGADMKHESGRLNVNKVPIWHEPAIY